LTPPAERQRRVVAYGAALVATPLLHGLAFPPARLHFLAWIALVPWFVALRMAGPGIALVLSAVVTCTGTYLVASWLPRAVAVYYGQPFVLGVALFAGAWTVTLAPWFLAFTVCYRAMARRASGALPLLVGAAWTASELGRVRLFGNPFGLLAYSQVPVIPVLQVADVTGVYGVSFLVATVNAALAELYLARRVPGRRPRNALAGAGLATAVVVLALGYSRLAWGPPSAADPPPTRVAIAQGNLDLGSQWRQEFYGRNLESYMRLTKQVIGESQPALVVWPESAMTFFLDDEPLYREALGRLLAPSRTELLAGGPRVATREPERYYNSAFLLAPEGRVLARYDKQRLLPFAEYFPLSSIDLLRREFGRVREFSPGAPSDPLPTVAGPAGVVICNESMFPEIVARRVREGARYLVNLSNDSWLADTQFAAQALDLVRVRAIEQRRWVVRASTSGPSAIVDPEGRLLAEAPPFTRGTIAGTVEASDRLTVYGRIGDAFALACAVLCIGFALRGALDRRREIPERVG
jgi:apolipoprotein N-acyltransferase